MTISYYADISEHNLMPRALNLIQNSFAVLALFAIISVSVITTLALSPTLINSKPQIQGVNTQNPQILSNFIPLEINDANDPATDYTSQLVQLTQSQYQYTATLAAHDKGMFSYKLVTIKNSNTAPVVVKFSSSVSRTLAESLNVTIVAGDTYRLHDVNRGDGRVVDVSVPANASIDVTVLYELVQGVSFQFPVSFAIAY